jgi:hypothetical protein
MISLSAILEAVVKLPRRYSKFGVGKSIGGSVYVHRDYIDRLPQDKIQPALEKVPLDFDYDVVKLNLKTGGVSFTSSPDFDTADEPTVGRSLIVEPSGHTSIRQPAGWIYHHKWLFVGDDYKGFDVEASKKRSQEWMSLPNIDYSRIGKKSYWDANVVPQLIHSRNNK